MKWIKRILAGILALVVLALLVIYVGGEIIINRTYEPESRNLLTSSRPDVVSRGERLARVYGCYEGCHGKDMEGRVFLDEPLLARVIAPNLTSAAGKYSDSELEAIIRQGIKPDGKSVLGMPSDALSRMTDQDLSSIVSFIRQYPVQENDAGESSFSLLARIGLILGDYVPAAAGNVSEPWETRGDTPVELGEYLAYTACSECHGEQLEGGFAPNLAIAKAYDLDAFRALMKEGKSAGGNDIGLMGRVAQTRFSHLTDAELEALHGYLHSL